MVYTVCMVIGCKIGCIFCKGVVFLYLDFWRWTVYMYIPVCNIAEYNNIVGTYYYNTIDNCIIDGECCHRRLPVVNILSGQMYNCDIYTIVGKAGNKYVVSIGMGMVVTIDKQSLLNKIVSNMKCSPSGRVSSIDGALQDLSHLFPDKDIEYINDMLEVQLSLIGKDTKFFGKYKGKHCVVKFNESKPNRIPYEELYYRVGLSVGVPVCRAYTSVYGGKPCAISEFEYKVGKDQFASFRTLGGDTDKILNRLSEKDIKIFRSMLLLDYLMVQEDRHLSNIAICNRRMYPLFDNCCCMKSGEVGYYSMARERYIASKSWSILSPLIRIDYSKILNAFMGFSEEFKIFKSRLEDLKNE